MMHSANINFHSNNQNVFSMDEWMQQFLSPDKEHQVMPCNFRFLLQPLALSRCFWGPCSSKQCLDARDALPSCSFDSNSTLIIYFFFFPSSEVIRKLVFSPLGKDCSSRRGNFPVSKENMRPRLEVCQKAAEVTTATYQVRRTDKILDWQSNQGAARQSLEVKWRVSKNKAILHRAHSRHNLSIITSFENAWSSNRRYDLNLKSKKVISEHCHWKTLEFWLCVW